MYICIFIYLSIYSSDEDVFLFSIVEYNERIGAKDGNRRQKLGYILFLKKSYINPMYFNNHVNFQSQALAHILLTFKYYKECGSPRIDKHNRKHILRVSHTQV